MAQQLDKLVEGYVEASNEEAVPLTDAQTEILADFVTATMVALDYEEDAPIVLSRQEVNDIVDALVYFRGIQEGTTWDDWSEAFDGDYKAASEQFEAEKRIDAFLRSTGNVHAYDLDEDAKLPR